MSADQEKIYTRQEVQRWRDDVAHACANLVERYPGSDPWLVNAVRQMAGADATEAVLYQSRHFEDERSCTPGWSEWEVITKPCYEDTIEYIKQGYKYEVRQLGVLPGPVIPVTVKEPSNG